MGPGWAAADTVGCGSNSDRKKFTKYYRSRSLYLIRKISRKRVNTGKREREREIEREREKEREREERERERRERERREREREREERERERERETGNRSNRTSLVL